MIFQFESPVNQNVKEIFLELFRSNGIDEKKADELAQQAKDISFLITDCEITHRFPNYGPRLTPAPNDIQQLVQNAVNAVNSESNAGIIRIGEVMKVDNRIKLVRISSRTKEPYGMYAADWYVKGFDADGKEHEGWESDFLIEK